jgi:hypothetical protein
MRRGLRLHPLFLPRYFYASGALCHALAYFCLRLHPGLSYGHASWIESLPYIGILDKAIFPCPCFLCFLECLMIHAPDSFIAILRAFLGLRISSWIYPCLRLMGLLFSLILAYLN